MENIVKLFIEANSEFKETKGSEKSVEKLWEIRNFLMNKERDFNENFILAQILDLLGDRSNAYLIIEKSYEFTNQNEKAKLKNLYDKIEKQVANNIKVYRDLRDSKKIKETTMLEINDFIIVNDNDNNYEIKISKSIEKIVILNKNIQNHELSIYTTIEPDDFVIELIIEHINWLSRIKDELLFFYNNNDFKGKLNNVGQNWFDGLEVSNVFITVKENYKIETSISIYDYLQNDYGFYLEIENRDLIEIDYDGNL